MANQIFQYYVEGDDEVKLINVLKSELGFIQTGKVQKFNVVQQKIRDSHLMNLKPRTIIILVFDTDKRNVDILNSNIEKLKECSAVKEVITIPQVHNLEDELIWSCDITDIRKLLNSKSKTDFKRDIIKISNLSEKLREHKFDIKQFWARHPGEPYQHIQNNAEKIKLL